MSSSPSWLRRAAAILALVFTASSVALAQEETPRRRRRRQGPAGVSILEKAEAIRKDVEAIRGLKFRADVQKGVKTTEALRKYVVESVEKEVNPDELEKAEKVEKKFGLIPRDYDLKKEMLALYSEQIAGFYDPDSKQLFCITRDAPMMGGMGFDQDELTMAHELEHALQDQTFDLRKRTWMLQEQEDRALAYKCVVEGEATVVGYTWLFEKRMGQPMPDLGMLNNMEKMARKAMPREKGKTPVPDYIMENLVFPYTTGAEFVQKFQKKFGWEKCAQLFNDPPTSTSQVMHPKKYWGEREEPIELRMPLISGIAGAKARELIPWGVMGEYNSHHVLRAAGVPESKALAAVTGWRGDRYQAIELDGEVVVAWLSTWETAKDAEKFHAAYARALERKKGPEPAPGKTRFRRLEVRGTEVALLDGDLADRELGEKLWRAVWCAEKVSEKRTPLPSLMEPPPIEDFGKPGATEPVARPVAPTERFALGARVDDGELGIAFNLPAGGFEKADESIKDLKPVSRGRWTHGEATLRVLDLPMPFDKAEIAQQFESAVRKGIKDYKKVKEGASRDVAGRMAVEFEFQGVIPGYKDGALRAARAVAVERDGTTLLFLIDAPAADLEKELAAFEHALATLDVETSPLKGERRLGKKGDFALVQPPGFEARSEEAPIVARLEDGKGASIMVQHLSTSRPLEAEARATEAFLARGLEGYEALGRSVIARDGRHGVILDYQAKTAGATKRVRMVVLDEGGRRATLALAAPSDRFDSYRAAFERVLQTFRLGTSAELEASSGPAPAPKAEPGKRRGKLY